MRNLITMILLAIGCASAPVLAQTRDYIQLRPEDAVAAKAAYDNLQQAQKVWQDVQDKVVKDYLVPPAPKPQVSAEDSDTVVWINVSGNGETWGGAFEFSKDFKLIVPKEGPVYAITSGSVSVPNSSPCFYPYPYSSNYIYCSGSTSALGCPCNYYVGSTTAPVGAVNGTSSSQ